MTTEERRQALLKRTILLVALLCLVLGDVYWARATLPGGSFGFFYVGCLGFWCVPWAYMMLITPIRAWSTVFTLSAIGIGWPVAWFCAQSVTCDSAIGLAGGILLLLPLLPASLFYQPMSLLIAFGVLTLIAALSLVLYKLLWQRWFTKWVVVGAFLSVPVVVAAVSLYLIAHGARPQTGNCVL